jgi:hypothetical protein
MTHTKDEALKLALEALERYQVKRQDFDRFADEITAIKQALAAPVQEQVAAELERIAQEPPVNGNNLAQARVLMAAQRIRNATPPATQPVPVQEPVAQPASEEDMKVYRAIADNYRKDLAAAQRQWVGLTDEEIEQGCKESWVTEQAFQSAVWWAEAKLKEKNT